MIKTKDSNIYIVMYHYVREIKNSKFPNIKGLEFSNFKKQINYFIKNFNIISNADLIEILETKKIPKKKSIFLTFDDGYKDHWEYVFPYLYKKKIPGCFYPPVQVIKKKKVLDVNKIHFILDREQNREKILNLIFEYMKKYLNKDKDFFNFKNINLKSRYDDKKTTLIKRLLQNHLPQRYRQKITDKIFEKILNIRESEFAQKLYMNSSQIKEMYKNNMGFGSHGDNHIWWQYLSYENQVKEIKKSINFFKKNKIYDDNFSVCFPYGSYNLDTVKILKNFNIKFALTTQLGSLNKNNIKKKFHLPRYDTNDFR